MTEPRKDPLGDLRPAGQLDQVDQPGRRGNPYLGALAVSAAVALGFGLALVLVGRQQASAPFASVDAGVGVTVVGSALVGVGFWLALAWCSVSAILHQLDHWRQLDQPDDRNGGDRMT